MRSKLPLPNSHSDDVAPNSQAEDDELFNKGLKLFQSFIDREGTPRNNKKLSKVIVVKGEKKRKAPEAKKASKKSAASVAELLRSVTTWAKKAKKGEADPEKPQDDSNMELV